MGRVATLFQKKSDPFEKGRFLFDEKKGKWVKVSDKTPVEGKYAMPLGDYLERKNHVTKGSWHRPTDSRHASREALQHDDFGKAGCRNGHGFNHPKRNGRCIYCNNTEDQIKKIHEKDERENLK